MATRVIVGVVGFALVLLVVYVFPPVCIPVLMAVFCALASFELLGSTKLLPFKRMLWVSLLVSAFMPPALYFKLPLAGFEAAGIVLMVYYFLELFHNHRDLKFSTVCHALFGALVLPFLLTSLQRIFFLPNGKYYVLIPLMAAWGSDCFALFGGMLLGKHKLAPVISPKKTIEGAVSGVFGGALCMVVFAWAVNTLSAVEISYVFAVIAGAAGAVIGQIGDLAFSVIKRECGIKDYGSVFPGHGGVLDRFDSVIFTAPVVEVMLYLAMQ